MSKKVSGGGGGGGLLEGRVIGVSHVLYSAGDKAFFARLVTDQGKEETVAFPLSCREHRKLYLTCVGGGPLQLSNHVRLSHLKRVRIVNGLEIWTAQEKSEVGAIPSAPSDWQPPVGRVVEGTVTDDAMGDWGIYTLNRKMLLVTTPICYVTNVTRLRKGHRVIVANGHLRERMEAVTTNVLVACGRSLVRRVSQGNDDGADVIHPKDDVKLFAMQSVVNIALKYFLNYEAILQIARATQALQDKFRDLKKRLYSSSAGGDGKSFLEKFLSVWCSLSDLRTGGVHSAVRDFCSPPDGHQCFAMSKGKIINIPATLCTLKSRMEEAMEEKVGQDIASGINFGYCTMDSDRLTDEIAWVGRITTTKSAYGQIQVVDDTAAIDLCILDPDGKAAEDKWTGKLVFVKASLIVTEWLSYQGTNWRVTYLIVKPEDLLVVPVDDENAETEGESDDGESTQHSTNTVKYTVVNASDPILTTDDKYIVACVKGRTSSLNCRLAKLSLGQMGDRRYLNYGMDLHFSQEQACTVRCSAVSSCSKSILYTRQRDLLAFKVPPTISEGSHSHLPSSSSFSVAEEDSIQENEAVSIVCIVLQRWIEEERFFRPRMNGCQSPLSDLPCRPTIPAKAVLHLKVASSLSANASELLSVYISKRHRHAYSLGILPGMIVRFENVEKMVSEKGNTYFISNFLTRLEAICQSESASLLGLSCPSALTHLVDARYDAISGSLRSFYVCKFSVEKILKLSASFDCAGCQQPLSSGVCDYVGCHSSTAGTLRVRATLLVADATDNAQLTIHDESGLRSALDIPDETWKVIVEEARVRGEVLYLAERKESNSSAGNGPASKGSPFRDSFNVFCDTLPEMEDSRFYRGMFILSLVFGAGFVCGYQFKSWRMEWLKRRRERLAVKLRDTQKQIDSMAT